MIYKKSIQCLFLISIIFLSCQGQSNKEKKNTRNIKIGETPLILDTLNFSLDVRRFYSDEDFKKGRIKKDTVFTSKEDENPNQPAIINYSQKVSYLKDTLALMGNQPFCTIHTLTTIDNKLMGISAETKSITQKESDNFIKFLTIKYGQYRKDTSKFVDKYEVYLWQLNDRIIQYSPMIDKTVKLTLSIDNSKETNTKEQSEPLYKGYIFIAKKDFTNQIVDNIMSGIFVYFRPNGDERDYE